MYNKGIMVNPSASGTQVGVVLTFSFTSPEITDLNRNNAEMEQNVLSSIRKQIESTKAFSRDFEGEVQSFAKGMNQPPGGAIVVLALTADDMSGIEYEVAEIENRVLDEICAKARGARHRGFQQQQKMEQMGDRADRRRNHEGSTKVAEKNAARQHAETGNSRAELLSDVDSLDSEDEEAATTA